MYALEFQSTVQNIIAAVPQGKQDVLFRKNLAQDA